MRTIKLIYIIPCLLFVFSACQKDNYAGPNAGIYGALTDAQIGGTLQLAQAGSEGNIRMVVNDPAKYPAPQNEDITLFADGSYKNTRIFAETYKMFPLYQSGPWDYPATKTNQLTQGDTLNVNIPAGQQTQVNFKVFPFYYITAPTVSDSTVTFTVTASTGSKAGNTLSGSNNCIILVNNYPIVNTSVSSNTAGKHYQNQFQFSVTNSILGAPFTPLYVIPATSTTPAITTTYSVPWRLTNLPKGSYYFRIGIQGNKANSQWNYSPVVQATIH
jgi:hypothetical protein